MTTKTWSEAVSEGTNNMYIFGDDDHGVLSCWDTFDKAKKELCRYMDIDETEFDEHITREYDRYELCQDPAIEDVVPVWIYEKEVNATCFADD